MTGSFSSDPAAQKMAETAIMGQFFNGSAGNPMRDDHFDASPAISTPAAPTVTGSSNPILWDLYGPAEYGNPNSPTIIQKIMEEERIMRDAPGAQSLAPLISEFLARRTGV